MRSTFLRQPLRAAAIVLAVAAAGLWGAAAWAPVDPRGQRLDLAAAVTVTITAAMCIVNRVRRDREKLFLADVIARQRAEVTRLSSQVPTIPMQALRPVPRRPAHHN